MKTALLILFLSTISLFAGPPWPGVAYAEVRAYAWPKTAPTDGGLFKPDMTLPEGVLNKDGALLNANQTKRLLTAASRERIPRGVAGCYLPHNAFVFYDAGRKPVAFLEICFDCFGSRRSPDHDSDVDFVALAALFAELKLPFGMMEKVDDVRKEWRSIETNTRLLELEKRKRR